MVAKYTAARLANFSLSTILLLIAIANAANAQCPGLGSITFTVVAAPEPSLSFPPAICNGQNATISVNETFASYLWNTGGTGSSINVNQSGTYGVTVTNTAGCDATANATVVVNPNPQPVITGPSTVCQNNTIVLSAAGSFTDWEWSNGATTPEITISAGGAYAVTVTDANGCTGTDDVVVTANSTAPQPEITSQPFICGQVTLNAGAGFASYNWSTGGNTQTVNVQQNGDYTVTVTDAAGCTGTDIINISIPLPIPVELTGPTSICTGGSATLTATAGFLAYFWSNGSNDPSITITQPGTYSVTATDINNCNTVDFVNITAAGPPPPQITGNTAICTGASIVLSLTENYPGILWSSGQTTQQITVSTVGTYAVTVTDANGCTSSNSVEVTLGSPLSFPFSALPSGCGQFTLEVGASYPSYLWSTGSTAQSIIVTQSGPYSVTVTDAGNCTGTVALTVVIPPPSLVQITGGQTLCTGSTTTLAASAGFVSYSWSNGATTATNTVNLPGDYTVTATDASGCTSTATSNVASLPDPVPVVAQPAPICEGGTATIAVTNPIFQNYNWSNGGTSSSITVSTAGTYTVTVTDAAGCTGTGATSLTANPAPVVAASQLPYQCNGLADLSATPGFPTYAWSNGGNTPVITVNQAGNYNVTATGANGCTATTNVNAIIPPAPQVVITGDPAICEGENTILSAPPGFTSYLWSTGQGSPSISVSSTGTFFVTVTDNFACTGTASFNVTVQPALVPQITGPTQICAGGSAIFTATGGPFATYIWSNGSQTPAISVSAPGTYGLTVTDAAGCTGTATVDLTVGNSLSINLSELPYLCNGEITLDAGAGFQTYNWSNGGSTQLETVSSNGNFTVTVTDATGCSGSATATVSIPAPPQTTISGPAQICEGETAVLTAPTGFTNYLWSNGQQNPGIAATTAGTYAVTVTDADGCQASASVSLAVNGSPQPIITGASTICQNSSTVLSAAGNFQNWAWSGGQTTPEINVSAAGGYTVTVTDANGCTGTDGFNVTVSSNLQPQIAALPYACNGQLTLDAGTGFQNYAWSNGGASQTVVVSQNGNYEVTVSDAGGCTGTAVFTATIPVQSEVAISGSPVFCTGDATVLTASAGFQTYIWSSGPAVAEITVSQPGAYTVTATDANGCTSTDVLTVVENVPPQPQILGSTTLCNGASTTLSANGNFPGILWSTGQTTPQITASTAGIIGLTVTDANGCAGTTSVEVTVATSLSPQIAALPYACNGQLTLDAGPGFQNYAWSNGGASQTVVVSQNGNYEVTVSDAGGCTGTAVFTATIPVQSEVAISGSPVFCTSDATVLTASAGFQTYIWSNGPAGADITVSTAGAYTVTATDANGCTSTDLLAVMENAPPQPQILGSTTLCNGASTTLSSNGNFPGILWSTGQTTPQITASTAGIIGLTVTDANGCAGTTSVEVTVATSLSPQIAALPYACNGQLTLDAGAGFQNYAWSNGGASQTVVVSQNGNYEVMVSDAGGCTGTAVFTATIPVQSEVAISGSPVFCTGDATVLTASAGFQTYIWSNGPAGADITVSSAGTYTVTTTDANGCTDTETVNVAATNISIPPQILGSATICLGNPTTLFLSAGYDTYLWSNGSTASSITVANPGLVSVTVSDAGGCTGETSIVVTAGSTLDPQVVQVSLDCSGLVGLGVGNAYTSYLWSNGGTNQITLVSQTGTYTVTVTDANGCTGVGSIFAQVPQQFSVSISGNTAFCPGGATILAATGGFQDYLWSNGATASEITVSQAGDYAVTVSDLNGCTGTAQVSVTVGTGALPQIVGSTVICLGGSTVLGIANAADFSQFLWSNGSTAPQITAATAGIFTVTTTDLGGCTATGSIEVTEGNTLAPVITEESYNCDGNVVLEAPDGFQGYFWSTGAGTPTLTVSQDGSYSLTVTDASGCTGTASIFVQVPEDILLVVQTPPTPICPGGTAQLSVAPGFADYAWNTGESTNAITIATPGIYGVTVTDLYGCTASDGYAFNFAAAPLFEIISNSLDCESAEAELELDLVDVSGSPSFLWSNGATTATLTTAQPGVFSVIVTDGNGCTATQTTEVSQQNSFNTFADTIEFVPGQVVSLVPPGLDFFPVEIIWSPAGILQGCDNCPTAQARPIDDVLVNYSAVSAAGCVQQGTFFLFYKNRLRPSVYAPNVFSPDSPFNPTFTLFGNDLVVEIKYLRVFSRWGESVFVAENLAPGDLSAGWDGTFRGQEMDPGVFVWVAEVVYNDGTTEVLKGDVTLIR